MEWKFYGVAWVARGLRSAFQAAWARGIKEGRPQIDLPADPVMVTAEAGDLVIAHHELMHGACANNSPDVRWRLFRV